MKKDFICIVCPQSCRLSVEDSMGEIKVEGYSCKRGIEYGKTEFVSPKRLITTTVKIKNGIHRRLPIMSKGEVPKDQMKDCINFLYSVEVNAPIKNGEVIVENICGTTVDIIASRSIKIKGE